MSRSSLWVQSVTNPEPSSGPWRDWQALMERVSPEHRFFQPEWFDTWNRTWAVGAGRWTGDLEMLAVRDGDGVLQGVHTVGIAKIGPLRAYSSAGFDQPSRPVLAAVGREEDVGRALGEHIAGSGWPLLRLGPVYGSSAAGRALLDALRGRGVPARLRGRRGLAVYDPPPPGAAHRREIIETKFAKKVLYYERRAGRRGDLETVHFRCTSPGETERVLADLATIEGRSWLADFHLAGMRFAPQRSNDQGIPMWRELIDGILAPRDMTDVWITYFDGQPASFVFCITAGTTRYIVANNFDERFKSLRVGFIPYWHTIDDALARGIEHLDYGALHLDYKKLWGGAYDDTFDVHFAVPHRLAQVPAKAYWAWKDYRERKRA